MRPNVSRRLRLIAIVGILAAMATILRYIETSLPLIPPFLKIDFSNIPALIGGFALGPVAGTIILFIKNLLYLPVTQTAGVGEIADFVISLALVLPTALIYKFKKNRKAAIGGMAVGTAAMSFVVAPLMNYFVLVPFYAALFFSSSVDAIIQVASATNAGITSLWTYILFAVVPFNLFKCAALCVLTGLLYKPLSPLLHKYS